MTPKHSPTSAKPTPPIAAVTSFVASTGSDRSAGDSAVTPHEPYELVLTPPAVRAIQHNLPEAVAAAVVEFLTGALVDNPQRVGKSLRGELAGIYSARRGTYRVLYRINDNLREVVVLRIDHRRRVYRS